jgi:hypothetical protein
LAAASLFACQNPRPAESSEPLTLQTYAVPGGQAVQLRGLLNQAFVWNDKAQAKATITPDGRLIVVGPQRIQDGVAALMDELSKKPPEAPPTVNIEYWLVLGKPGKGAAVPDDLAQIAPALQTIGAEDGPQELRLLEHVQQRSLSDNEAEMRGVHVRVRQNATVLSGKVLADISIHSLEGPSGLDTRLELPPGQLMVLGQGGYNGKPEDLGTLYYVVRASIQGAGGK